jgi:hypothetical protein
MVDDLDFDPMIDARTEKQQKSVDRARAQSHLILRRSIAELAKLQKARFLCEQSQDKSQPAPGPVPASTSTPAGFDALMALADKQLAQRYRESGLSSFCNPAPTPPAADGSFCKTHVGQVSDLPSSTPAPAAQPKTAPRNAPCPCGSGQKYKRCCARHEANASGASVPKPGWEASPLSSVPPAQNKAA